MSKRREEREGAGAGKGRGGGVGAKFPVITSSRCVREKHPSWSPHLKFRPCDDGFAQKSPIPEANSNPLFLAGFDVCFDVSVVYHILLSRNLKSLKFSRWNSFIQS